MTTYLHHQSADRAFEPDPSKPAQLLRACPAYKETPVLEITQPNGRVLLVKDETQRMNLGAFKALGGVYAVAQLIALEWETHSGEKLEVEDFASEKIRAFANRLTFVCASAGNHGMAVAAGARIFGANARIHLAREMPDAFEKRLQAKGASVVRSSQTYDHSVAEALRDVEASGAILLADGSWPGYTVPPSLVMEGYTIIAEEMRREFEVKKYWPSHVYLQAGVGGMAAAITFMIRKNWAEQPEIIIVEPEAAPCLMASSKAGKVLTVEGPVSNMGRLDCKAPSILAFDLLERSNVNYMTVSDEEADLAVAKLAEDGIATTPSGAAGLAGQIKSLPNDHEDGYNPLIIVSEGAL
ncbi:MAG: pyridoxal-phosphate dependent enzyme [Rhizobiaceae bacterium]